MFDESDEEFLNPQGFDASSMAIPDITQWDHLCSFLCFDFNRVRGTRDLYCNEWKVMLCPPLYVVILIIVSILFYLFSIRSYLSFANIGIDILMVFTNLIFFTSYLLTIFEGPGFLPYFYPLQLTKRSDGLPDYLSGVASNKQQEEYVKMKPRMNRVGFFQTVSRYVIRPDHFCGWTGQFIGKKNYKLFILFNFWGMIYLGLFTAFDICAIVKNLSNQDPDVFPLVLSMLLLMQSVLFTFLTTSFFIAGLINTHTNTTQLEQMKKNSPSFRKSSCCENWEEVCGSREKWYLWILPIPAFHDKSPEYLATHIL